MKPLPLFLLLVVLLFAAQTRSQTLRERDSLLQVARSGANDTTCIWAMMETGKLYLNSNADSAVIFLDQALKWAQKIHFDKAIARCLINKAYAVYNNGRYNDALGYGEKAIPICAKLGLKKELGAIYNTIANVWNTKGNHWLAIEYYEKALQVMENADVPPFFPITVRNNLCILYGDLGLSKKRLENALINYQAARKIKDETLIGLALQEMGNAYLALGQLAPAKNAFEEAVIFARRVDHSRLLITSLLNLGDIELKRGNATKAREIYDVCLSLAQKNQDRYNEMLTYHGISEVELFNKRVLIAEKSALQALDIAQEIDVKDYTFDIYLTLSDIALAKGDMIQYQQYRNTFELMRDSLNNKSLVRALEELEVRYQTRQKEQRILQLRQEKEIQGLRIRQKNVFIWGLAGLAFLLLLSGYLVYRYQQTRRLVAEKNLKIQEQQIRELEQEKQLNAASAMLRGQEEERSRIARDLHDGLGGMLSGVKQTLFGISGNQILPELAAHAFHQVVSQLDSSISELRNIARNMMPEALVRFGLSDALADFCNHLQTSGQLVVHFQAFGLEKRLDQDTEIVVFRIVQELVNNVVKHALASQVIVQVIRDEQRVHLTVEDDGKGFDPAKLQIAPGIGWLNIQSRVNYLGGNLDLQTGLGKKGTTVSIEFKLKSEA